MKKNNIITIALMFLILVTPVVAFNEINTTKELEREITPIVEEREPIIITEPNNLLINDKRVVENSISYIEFESNKEPTRTIITDRIISIDGMQGIKAEISFYVGSPNKTYTLYRHPEITTDKLKILREGQRIKRVTSDSQGWVYYTLEKGFSTTLLDATAYWSFDEGTGTVATDITGNNNDGTITGATWTNSVSAKLGVSALDFGTNAQNRYVEVSGIGSLIGVDDYTVNLWFYAIETDNRQRIIFLGDTSGYSNVLMDIHIVETTNSIRVQFRDGSSGTATLNTGIITLNEWSMITVVRSGNTAELYLNSISEDVITNDNVGSSNTNNLQIGRMYGSTDNYAGLIDEVSIYDFSLTETQIEDLYNNGIGFNPFSNNFLITAVDTETSTGINNFYAYVTDSEENTVFFNTTNGVINTEIEQSTDLYNIIVGSIGREETIYNNYEISTNLEAELTPITITQTQEFNNPEIIQLGTTKNFILDDYFNNSYRYEIEMLYSGGENGTGVILGDSTEIYQELTNRYTATFNQEINRLEIETYGSEHNFSIRIFGYNINDNENISARFDVSTQQETTITTPTNFLTSDNLNAQLLIFILLTALLIYLGMINPIFSYFVTLWFLYWGMRFFQSGVDTYISVFMVFIGIIFLFIPVYRGRE